MVLGETSRQLGELKRNSVETVAFRGGGGGGALYTCR